jgi:uncharacterized protein YhaN
VKKSFHEWKNADVVRKFAQYDEARTRNAIELLAKESQTRQIMLFTCKKREVELIQEIWGAFPLHIINLDAEES